MYINPGASRDLHRMSRTKGLARVIQKPLSYDHLNKSFFKENMK